MKQTPIRKKGIYVKSQADYLKIVGNKSVYSLEELEMIYKTSKNNLIVIEMVYNGYFGSGKNVTFDTLERNGLFNRYPYEIELSKEDVFKILGMGGKNVQDIVIN